VFAGAKSALTLAATRMMELCGQRLTEKEERFMRLEKAINPLLDDNDQVKCKTNVVSENCRVKIHRWPLPSFWITLSTTSSRPCPNRGLS
jgi:transcription initiation factor TFIID subunit 1